MSTSAQVRRQLVEALELDLIGPAPDDSLYAQEELDQAPSNWYLSGFLVPSGMPLEEKIDGFASDEIAQGAADGDQESTPEEAASARKAFFPSSMGLSFLLAPSIKQLAVIIDWGEYSPILNESTQELGKNNENNYNWKRKPQTRSLLLDIDSTEELPIPDSDGLYLYLSLKQVNSNNNLPDGTRAVSLFLANNRQFDPKQPDIHHIFQAKMTISAEEGFVPRRNLREDSPDEDERINDLQYQHDYEFAVGHNISVVAKSNDQLCQEISTSWIPSAQVPRVEAASIEGLELNMETLANASSAKEIRKMLGSIVSAYQKWLEEQEHNSQNYTLGRRKVAKEILAKASKVKERISAGLDALEDPLVLEAFCLTNKVIAQSIRQRLSHQGQGKKPEEFAAPKWKPFQIAFLLMNLVGISQPNHQDREIVDLLFFPTGGGKTEAYLGIAAFTMLLRRLRDPSIASAGVTILMRYTLRLLTLDQLGRSATLICALELERQSNPAKLGEWPFEIGLWVGEAATPNRMGKKGDKDENSAYSRWIAYKTGDQKKSPIPLENCPWCGKKFDKQSFIISPSPEQPKDLKIFCTERFCKFRNKNPLPIVAVDESIYRRLPAFLISTVDKFASLPWVGLTAGLFGKVSSNNYDGFYGPANQSRLGQPLTQNLQPIDLIIQDELHLISGPLGTMFGLYETAIEYLCSSNINGKKLKPKIIASTATVRRASSAIRSLFARESVEVFPPPGPDRHDSFFAKTVPVEVNDGRLYVGIAAQGRSLKVVLLRTYLVILSAAQKAWEQAGKDKNPANPADPYMTLLGYFNSLRELGGSRRIVEDEVKARLEKYAERKRQGDKEGSFNNRTIANEPIELTSRVNTSEVADAKSKLEQAFSPKKEIDVVLATNMISVGLDITRLGLMVVLGQPKSASEYIQATSRVGRDVHKPGLVITLLNVHRPRDRSHYERFEVWHRSFYRAVEATSVTPFSPRALDRGLAAIVVALARLGQSELTAPTGASDIAKYASQLDFVFEAIQERAESQSLDKNSLQELKVKLELEIQSLLDGWQEIVKEKNGLLQYQLKEEAGDGAPPLLFDPLDENLLNQPPIAHKFKVQRSLRDVEPTVKLWTKNPYQKEQEN